MQLARDVANMIVFMADGTIVEQGPTENAVRQPKIGPAARFKRYRDTYLL